LDGSLTNVGQTSDGNQTKVERTSDGNRTKIRRTSDEQNSAAAVAMASGDTALQLLATQRCDEAGRALQLAVVARPAADCSSLLRQWPAALQLAALALGWQRCNLRRWPTACYSPSPGFCFFFFFFVFYSTTLRAKERDKKRKGGGAFETYSKISTLLVGRNVTRKLPPVSTQAPSGSSNTPTPSGSNNSSTNNSNINNNSRTYK